MKEESGAWFEIAMGVLSGSRIPVSTSGENALWWSGFAIGKVR
jgi:hypothetical protein